MGPGKCIPIPADMQKLSEVERLVTELSRKESKLHVLVNNAGATWGATVDEYPVSILVAFNRHLCSLICWISGLCFHEAPYA